MRPIGCLIAALGLCLLPSIAMADTIVLDLNKAKFFWDWTKGPLPNAGDPEGFTIKCGMVSGVYSSSTPINDPTARSANLIGVVNGSGVWFCVVGAQNRYGASPNSNEISFDAGVVPAGPVNLRVQVQ